MLKFSGRRFWRLQRMADTKTLFILYMYIYILIAYRIISSVIWE